MAENDFGIAIIGMAGRFPQADTVQAFWENLLASRECISFYSDEELLAMGISPEFVQHPDYVKAKGEVADIDKFDAAFFGIAPREAELMDPQRRKVGSPPPMATVGRFPITAADLCPAPARGWWC